MGYLDADQLSPPGGTEVPDRVSLAGFEDRDVSHVPTRTWVAMNESIQCAHCERSLGKSHCATSYGIDDLRAVRAAW